MTIYQLYHILQKKSSKSRKFFARLLKYFFASGKLGTWNAVAQQYDYLIETENL